MITAHPMRYHGPGWEVGNLPDDDSPWYLYELWAPKIGRPGWAAAWARGRHAADTRTGDSRRGETAAEALAGFPDDQEGRAARDALLAAAAELFYIPDPSNGSRT